MQFIVIAHDCVDNEAINRRLDARNAHLDQALKMYEEGKWLYAAGILDDNDKMIGSMIICDFSSRKELEEQWLKNEPYILGNVWDKIEINRASVAPFITNKQGQ